MEHALEYITFCVQKYTAPLAICSNFPLVREKPHFVCDLSHVFRVGNVPGSILNNTQVLAIAIDH